MGYGEVGWGEGLGGGAGGRGWGEGSGQMRPEKEIFGVFGWVERRKAG